MSEEKNMNNEIKEEGKVEAPAADQQNDKPDKPEKPKKDGFFKKLKTFGKKKVLPTAKLIGKGAVAGASMAGAALGTAFLIGMAVGGYSSAKGEQNEEASDGDQADTAAEAEKPAETDDVTVSLSESNVDVESNIE